MSSWYSMDSSRIFIVASGVFSSCDALETNSLREASRCSNFSLIWLNVSARRAISSMPCTSTRPDKSPRPMRLMPSVSAAMGLVMMREKTSVVTSTASATAKKYSSIRSCMARRLSTMSCTLTE